jgi:hypothetical protein
VSDEVLYSRVASSKAGQDEAVHATDLLPDMFSPRDRLRWGWTRSLNSSCSSGGVCNTLGESSYCSVSFDGDFFDQFNCNLSGR